MWSPLTAIKRLNRGRKLLHIFQTESFLIDRYARFTEALSSSVLLWRVLETFSSMYVYKLEGFQLMTVRTKNLGTKRSCWRQPVLLRFAACAGAPSDWKMQSDFLMI